MSLPTLTPKSTTSVTILPSSVTLGAETTAAIQEACAIGTYAASQEFLTGAAKQVAYTYKKLGGDVLDLEITSGSIYANYEEAVHEYSYIVNLHQSKNALGSALGSATASFDHKGEPASAADGKALKYPKFKIDYALRMGDTFSHESGIGGVEPVYSASFDSVDKQQDYDLQSIVETASATEGEDFSGKIGTKRIIIRDVYYRTPMAMWRFYGYYGGLNVVGNFHNYGQFADDSSFQVIPPWHNKMQAIQYEDHLYTRTSHYSYEIIDNKLRLYPVPTSVSPDKFYFRFSIRQSDPYTDDNMEQINGVNNMNTLPFENIAYEKINSIGKQWIRRFALALSKETLGQVRGKFGGDVPIPGDKISLNASDLLGQAKDEQTALRDELKTILAEMTYDKLIETDKGMVENQAAIIKQAPLKIFVG